MRILSFFIVFVFCCVTIIKAQHSTPPSLPSLLDGLQKEDAYEKDPVLNGNENPQDKIHNNIFIKVTANKTSCYVGEPILVTYELFSALRSQSKVSKQPTFTGCSVVELTTDQQPVIQKSGDKYYRVFLIRKVELIPLKEGNLKMDVASVESDVTFFSKDDPYQSKTITGTTNSTPFDIEVKPLPVKDAPPSFSGVIGKFDISAKVDSNEIAKGENNTLKISIKGEGNLPAITSPEISWPAGLEHFDISDSQRIDKMSFPMKGECTFEIPFIGTKEGNITIPEIAFSYFDASSSAYKTVYTEPISIAVTHALSKSQKFKNIITRDVSNKKYLWIVPAIALVVAFGWFVSSKTKKKTDKPIAKKEDEIKINTVKEETDKAIDPVQMEKAKTDFKAELNMLASITETPVFFTYTKSLLTLALQEKLQTRETEEIILVEMLQFHDKRLAEEAKEIYNSCNLSLYSPIVEDDVKIEVQNKFNDLIRKLELTDQSVYL